MRVIARDEKKCQNSFRAYMLNTWLEILLYFWHYIILFDSPKALSDGFLERFQALGSRPAVTESF